MSKVVIEKIKWEKNNLDFECDRALEQEAWGSCAVSCSGDIQ